jgi:unsaturated chondroitin disaccharide hydrolase
MNTRKFILPIVLLFFTGCSNNEQDSYRDKAASYLSETVDKTKQTIQQGYKFEAIPKGLTEDGKFLFCSKNWDWMEGFFPGICWYLYDFSGDDEFKKAAIYFQSQFEEHKTLTNHHDLGFIFNNSYGHGFRFTGDESQKKVMIEAANSLAQRYIPNVGCLKSWDTDRGWQAERGWKFPVIIDNMMNLELLFEAALLTNDSRLTNAAVNHANTTLKNHFRDDYSSYHVVDFDPETGAVRNKQTAQGYSDSSSWVRGQAWGLYGFTMCYRYTKDEKYLHAAEEIASFILNHPNLPADKIPYWDFNSPEIPKTYRDVSAATITASALIELNEYSKYDYLDTAKKILENVHANYKNNRKNSILLLDHSVGSVPHNSMIDVPIVYADYYYVEALWRLQKKVNKIQ